jgi:hypothetical protein
MDTKAILVAIDAQIAQLEQARSLLTTDAKVAGETPRRGRPKSSTNKTAVVPAAPAKRTVSEEGKLRIAAAQKLRWANQKKAAKPVKSPAKKSRSAAGK